MMNYKPHKTVAIVNHSHYLDTILWIILHKLSYLGYYILKSRLICSKDKHCAYYSHGYNITTVNEW